MYRSLSNYLLLPWPNLPDSGQQWDVRAQHHVTFLKQLLHKFLSLEGTVSALSDNKHLLDQGEGLFVQTSDRFKLCTCVVKTSGAQPNLLE